MCTDLTVSVHLSGVAVAYDSPGHCERIEGRAKDTGQGSLVNYQKRTIADAVEYIRRNAVHKPLIFVATSPGYVRGADEKHLIQKLTHNLRNGYGVKEYVWVRELTKMGFPHFHFVADCPFIRDPRELSMYWSSLFGVRSDNSIRLGSKPIAGKPRKYYVTSQKMATYLSKYLGKGFDHERDTLAEAGFPQITGFHKTYRNFAISQQARMMSKPIMYEANYHFDQPDEMVMTASGVYVQKPAIVHGRTFQDDVGRYFNPHAYSWKQVNPLFPVYFGMKKSSQLKFKKDVRLTA